MTPDLEAEYARLVLEDPGRSDAADRLAKTVICMADMLKADPDWMQWMTLAAQTNPKDVGVFVVGVRGHNGSWFATWGNVECDGPPVWSVPSVIDQVRKATGSKRNAAEGEVKEAQRVIDLLPEVKYPKIEEE